MTLKQHPLLVYAALEAGIGLCALVVHGLLPVLNQVYFAGAEHGLGGMLSRGLFAAVVMLPATILMGASLPAIVRWIEATPVGVAWWGFLYGGNTLGAVLGCLIAGFYLLRVYDMAITTYVAVAINLVVAAVSFILSKVTPAGFGKHAGCGRDIGSRRRGALAGLPDDCSFRRDGAGR